MINDIQTTENYWDCECVGMPDEYIHPKSQLLCIECGQHQDDMPDSRIDEVAQLDGVRSPTHCGFFGLRPHDGKGIQGR